MKKFKLTTGIPPLILIGTIIVLFPIFAFMTFDRINKQKSQSIKLLVEKSTALIRAFEAGTYSSMMSLQWTRSAMENLLTETAALPDIAYLFVVDKNGVILAHNQQGKTGKTYGQDLDLKAVIRDNKTGWRIITSLTGKKVFEVHKKFSPINKNRLSNIKTLPQWHQHMHAKAFQNADQYENTVIFVGLDMELIASADKGDTQHAIMMAVILALIGFTGFVLVFIVQRYTQTRSSLSRMQIFSDNLVENMPLGLIATDTNNQIVSVNPAASFILGISPDSTSHGGNIILPAEINYFLDSVCGQENLQEKEIELKSNADTAITLEVFASPLRDKEGQFLGTLLILRDKTELLRLKAEMEQNKRLAAIGRLAAGVAHEIRNPLSSLKGYAVFFKEVFDHDSENFAIADTMTKEVDRLNRVVSELVELAKPVAVSGNPVDIQALVLETSRLISHEPDAKSIDLKTRFEPNLPMIHADTDRLKQVLLNLYLNAIQAMDGIAGTLEIAVQKTPDNSHLTICVSDTGKGMTEEELSSIFEPYFTTKLSGTGLGLAIVHNIIQAHKGKIKAESKPGKGSVFTITLPIRTD